MATNDIDLKLKEIEDKYKEKIRAIKQKRNEDLNKLRKSIDQRRIDKITNEIKRNI